MAAMAKRACEILCFLLICTGLLQLVHSEEDQCSVPEHRRIQCRTDTVSEAECVYGGCCYKESPGVPTCFYSNWEQSGYIIRAVGCDGGTEILRSSSNRKQCGVKCLADRNCIRFDFRYQESEDQCVLYSTTCKDTAVTGVNTYDKVAATDFLCRRGNCPGNNLPGGSYDVDSQECKEMCEGRTDCQAYQTVYMSSASHTCYLKDTVCDDTDLSAQPGQICDRVNSGVMLKNANDDYSGLNAGALRDDSMATCVRIPTADSDRQYLYVRLTWPVIHADRQDYKAVITGIGLRCDPEFMTVRMKIGATWGDPNYDTSRSCHLIQQTPVADSTVCEYGCQPNPYFGESLVIRFQNHDFAAQICEVAYEELD